MKRHEVTLKTNRTDPSGERKADLIQVSENSTTLSGNTIAFPAFSLSIGDAQELLIDLGEALMEAQGFVRYTRA